MQSSCARSDATDMVVTVEVEATSVRPPPPSVARQHGWGSAGCTGRAGGNTGRGGKSTAWDAYLERSELVVEDEGQHHRRHNREFHPECVVVAVVGGFELLEDEEDGCTRSRDEEHLHEGVVDRDEREENIEISGGGGESEGRPRKRGKGEKERGHIGR